MDKDISTALREVRTETGWSEPRIASELGISQPTVNRILNGQDDCKAKTFRAIQILYKKVCVDALDAVNSPSDPQNG
jgi:transcriptional regulator with XRE-family HTH domain